MTEETARRSIDWVHSIGSRVLALMGGEPLLRPNLSTRSCTTARRRTSSFIFRPTGGCDDGRDHRLGDAGVANVNLAIDSVKERKELPKALEPIRPYFEYLVKRQHQYGYSVMLNINICRTNIEDVRELTEIAHDNGVATDYHINESPMTEQEHFKRLEENSTYLTPEDWPKVDELLDWLDAKRHNEGYKMVNQSKHMQDMKLLLAERCRSGSAGPGKTPSSSVPTAHSRLASQCTQPPTTGAQ